MLSLDVIAMADPKTTSSKATVRTESAAKKKTNTKLCLHCGRVKELSEYYVNKDWVEQLGKDTWCKDCVNRCSTKDEIREYFWENCRDWNDRIWEAAKKKAEALASKNLVYQKASEDRRNTILEKLTCQQIPTVMQTSGTYKHVDNTKDGKTLSYAEAKENGEVIEETDPNVKVWSEEWCGMFSQREIEWLNNYYNKLTEDGKLEFDATQDDYAHKIAHASLMNNKAVSDFNAGRCDYSVVKDTANIFDMYNKSANFAMCKRRTDVNDNKGSFGELVAYLETHGRPCTKKIEFEKDDIDMLISELGHIVRAIGLDT